MNKTAYAILIAGAIITAAAADVLYQARNQLRSNRLLGDQMEEDHARLVHLYVDMQRRMTSPLAHEAEKMAEGDSA